MNRHARAFPPVITVLSATTSEKSRIMALPGACLATNGSHAHGASDASSFSTLLILRRLGSSSCDRGGGRDGGARASDASREFGTSASRGTGAGDGETDRRGAFPSSARVLSFLSRGAAGGAVSRAHRGGRRVLLVVHQGDGDDGDDGRGRHGLAHGDRQLLALGHPGSHGASPAVQTRGGFWRTGRVALPTRRAVDAMRRRPRRSRVCGVQTAGSGTATRGVDGGACVPGSMRADALTARRVQPRVPAVGLSRKLSNRFRADT